MPLVVPDVTTNSADKTEEWMRKLVGKKLSDEGSSETNFCKTELPQECRVIKPGMMVTKDFKPDRLNVHVDDEGTVSHVHHG
ncbi:uncharacterized protein DNG_06765 [Cephalotrichum gorgonifer]|uniref:Uncharacterized protein n=1 Tax=Cephalotrichum gorgonifer TaxID=2041049 RepID=A0AAE8SXL9_9PEZI|nr:uncharacterized protein DNG_06765 [Cephalotrichum gorgonifer]